jgi:hypothetical protein
MPTFDPTLPLAHSRVQSGVLRDQLNALKGLIDAVPAPVQSSGANGQIQIADGNGAFASDPNFYFLAGDGWTSLRCQWPTTDPQIAGALWNNNGVLNVSAG